MPIAKDGRYETSQSPKRMRRDAMRTGSALASLVASHGMPAGVSQRRSDTEVLVHVSSLYFSRDLLTVQAPAASLSQINAITKAAANLEHACDAAGAVTGLSRAVNSIQVNSIQVGSIQVGSIHVGSIHVGSIQVASKWRALGREAIQREATQADLSRSRSHWIASS